MGGTAQMGRGEGRGEGSRGSAAVPGQDGGEQAWQERAGTRDKMGGKAVQTSASAAPRRWGRSWVSCMRLYLPQSAGRKRCRAASPEKPQAKVQRIRMVQQSFQSGPVNRRTSGVAPFYGQLKIHPLPRRAEVTAMGEPRESFFIEMTVFTVYK